MLIVFHGNTTLSWCCTCAVNSGNPDALACCSRRIFMRYTLRLLPALAICFWTDAALAADAPYPAKTVRIVVAFAAGGSTDLLARSVAQRLNEAWKTSVIVDNRAGGGGIVGSDHVA